MLKRLDNVGIAVSDAARAVEFYTTKLGFQGAAEGGEGSVRLGDISLYLFQSRADGSPASRTTDYYGNPVGLDHLAFEVDDIEAASQELENRGVQFDQDIVGEPGSFRYRALRDPDDNMIYVIQHPSSG